MSDDLVKDALRKFTASQEGSDHNRDDYYSDTVFARMAEQWPDAVKKQRVQEGRPHLVINKLPSLIRSIVNEARQNRPGIKVSPVDNDADEATAEVIGGLVRSIERQSNSQIAYTTAIDNSVTGGMGFFRIDIDYVHDQTFDMEALIKRIPNALTVHYDTTSTEFDSSDWDYAFISDMLSRDEFKRRFPEASETPFESDTRDVSSDHWISTNDEIRVAEYFKREAKTRKLLQFRYVNQQTGQFDIRNINEVDLPKIARESLLAGGMTVDNNNDDAVNAFIEAIDAELVNDRMVEYHEVTKHLLNGVEELDDADDWPGQTIPICPVWGDEVFIDGRRHFRSLIRDVKDSQQMYNFWRSATTELVALAPKAPWVGPKGFVPKGQESKWASANTRSHAFLEYDPSVAAPERQTFAGVPAGALQEALNASDDMKAITGIYDSSVGARSNEVSGKAILARERQGDVSNYHFIDNLSRAIQSCGQILVEIIPHVYGERDSIRILGLDQKEKVVKLAQQGGGQRDGKLYDLSVGKYDVTVSTGPSFGTQREETKETLIELMRQVPDAAPYIGDMLLNHMDFVGADKLSKRLSKLLPPEIQAMEEEDIAESDNPEAATLQQQLKQVQQDMKQREQQLMQEFQAVQQENETLKTDKQIELQKATSDSQIKMKELQIKEGELQIKQADLQIKQVEVSSKRELPQQEKWAYDRSVILDNQAFEAGQNERDRQVDLAKTIISSKNQADGHDDSQGVVGDAMVKAVEILAAPKRVIRDGNGVILGVETIGVASD
jgi:hypothetical protein